MRDLSQSAARLLWLCAVAAPALAQPPAGYEERLVQWALERSGRAPVADPAGRPIDEILIVSEDIVAPSDPYPPLLNWFHVKTRDRVIRRELLLKPGDPWSEELAAESERNLRNIFILAIARVIPVEGSSPDSVALLVATKDLWSIRLGSEFSLVQGTLLQYLRLRPTESNFLGLNHSLSADFELKLDTLAFGQIFTARRVFDSKVTLSESARAFFNRRTLAFEGSAGWLQAYQPLTSLADTDAWAVQLFWDVRPIRLFRRGEIWRLPYPSADAPASYVPFVYDARSVLGNATYTRSFGSAWKLNLSGGLAGYARRYEPPPESDLDAAERSWFACNGLPRNEDAVLLVGSASLYEARYEVLHDVETFGLSEDFRLGPTAVAQVRWSDPAFFSPQRYAEAGLSLRYRAYLGGHLVTASLAGSTRLMQGDPGCGVAGPWVNRRFAAQLYEVSPVLGFGRLVARALVDFRGAPLSRQLLVLGGSNGLRGAEAEQYAGYNLALVNLEYRTLPIELLTLHVGFVLFLDAGAAFPQSPWVHSVGLGLRFLFPQFDRETVRIDFGYVFDEPGGPRPPYRYFSASFGQVTDFQPGYLGSPLD